VLAPESPTVTRESLRNDSSRDQFADSLPDISQSFEAWLESLGPPAKPIDSPAQDSAIRFEGTLHLECNTSSIVHSQTGTLTVGETAELHGNIFVAVAIINGFVRADILASERVELGSEARVIGNIETPALAIQPGAVFEGQCHFLPPTRKTDSEGIARSSVDDSRGSKGSSRRTRSKPAKQKDSAGLALAAGR
jgi:cytoskeletal protein CcmA (bactofilin family)